LTILVITCGLGFPCLEKRGIAAILRLGDQRKLNFACGHVQGNFLDLTIFARSLKFPAKNLKIIIPYGIISYKNWYNSWLDVK
jgi:ribonuclease BN (tRNA processing enzyme)